MSIVKTVLQRMSSTSKPQQTFLTIVLTTLMYLPGKANFRNLRRYSDFHEKTYSRWFRRTFDITEFNRLSLAAVVARGHTVVVALDCSLIQKSGVPTYGLDYFYNSAHNRAEKGVEISTLARVDVEYNTASHLSSRQPPKLDNPAETRVDWYLKHRQQERGVFPPDARHIVAEGYYSKGKHINGIRDLNLHLISKLRHDANRRGLYHGPHKLRGRRRQYDGKVGFLPQDQKRFETAGKVEGVQVYTAVVNSVQFKRHIRLVYLIKTVGQNMQTALLFSTDIELSALESYRLYKARFQSEFLFRDAKQVTGLLDWQARGQAALQFHLNASMPALNRLKLEDRQLTGGNSRSVISIASWKLRKFNEHLLERFSSIFGLNFSLIKSSPDFETLCNYRAVAA